MEFDETPIDSNAPPKRKPIRGILSRHQSYGLAIFARSTCRCVVVKRRYTFAYYDLLRGNYRPTYLDGLLNSLTRDELGLVTKMALNLDRQLLKSEATKYIYQYTDSDFEQAVTMLQYSQQEILTYSRRTDLDNLLEEWTLPKGRQIEDESIIECALRECKEELGISIPKKLAIHASIVETHISRTNGVEYIATYWPILVEEEFPLPQIEGKNEVSGRCWMAVTEAEAKMRNYNSKVLIEARASLNLPC